MENGGDTRYSQPVTHASTNRAQRCLTSVIGREPVFPTWYGRRQTDYTNTSPHHQYTHYEPYLIHPLIIPILLTLLAHSSSTIHIISISIHIYIYISISISIYTSTRTHTHTQILNHNHNHTHITQYSILTQSLYTFTFNLINTSMHTITSPLTINKRTNIPSDIDKGRQTATQTDDQNIPRNHPTYQPNNYPNNYPNNQTTNQPTHKPIKQPILLKSIKLIPNQTDICRA